MPIMIIKEGLPQIADRMIKAGEKKVEWSSVETRFTHGNAIMATAVPAFATAFAFQFAGEDISNPLVHPFETTANLLVDHSSQVKGNCLQLSNIIPEYADRLGHYVDNDMLAESKYSDASYDQPISEIAERILTPEAISTTAGYCGDAYEQTETIITTTAREKEIAQNILKNVAEVMKPFRISSLIAVGYTCLSVAQTFWYGSKGWLDQKIVRSSHVVPLIGKLQIMIGNSLKANSAL